MELGEQGAARVDDFAAREVGVAEHRVDDHLVALGVDPGRVAADDHRQALLRQADAAERPDVVVVQRDRLDLDQRPSLWHVRLLDLADLERR